MFSTASSKEEAKTIASHLVQQQLVACVNIVPSVESVYMWEGKVQDSKEFLMIIKVRSIAEQIIDILFFF
jgi:periplasmic divalent cation tolerance protein